MQDTPGGRLLAVRGEWTSASLTGPPVWEALTAQLGSLRGKPGSAAKMAGAERWSLAQLEKLDYLGAQVLWNHWGRAWPAQIELEPEQRVMLETVEKFTVDLPRARKSASLCTTEP